uniref:DNA-directed DNA polymerase n=1 Tax=Schizaphis graminum TaxID=13262 RepID=A0A2S2NB19_SCHGA
MDIVNTRGFVKTGTSLSNKINWYYMKNTDNLTNYSSFLVTSKRDLIQLLKSLSTKHQIKYNLKLEATYNRPHVGNSAENRAFKTSAKEIFIDTDIEANIDLDFANLMSEEDVYTSKGSGFTLQSIDGLLLGVYKYTPMGASSYIPLPNFIENKKAVINPQNIDQQCFKWAILAKHVTGINRQRIENNYTSLEEKYNFSGITFPTKLHEVKIFEKNNPNVSVNVYGLEKKIQSPQKFPKYEVFPLKVVEQEKADHFDLLLITDEENSHFTYITNFSRLVRAQKTSHDGHVIFCKRCFTSFDSRPRKNTLSGPAALEQHKLICGTHKPIRPQMPAPGSLLEFNAWKKTQRHPIVIYADFEAILKKSEKKCGNNTTIIQKHEAMSYGLLVKADDNIPVELLEKFNIPTSPVIYRGSEDNQNVAKHFVKSIVEIAENIEKLLKTNTPIILTPEQEHTHNLCNTCNLCKCNFSMENHKVADHCHLSGKFRQTLCNTCNLKLQTPNFVPCFFHNLSNYDAHFIVTELGYDSKTISVIPNSEEKFISFSKYISNTFTIRFVDTLRFMASSLSTLASNLISPGFEKFRETAKHFSTEDMQLVTR